MSLSLCLLVLTLAAPGTSTATVTAKTSTAAITSTATTSPPFIKGEIGHAGAIRLAPRRNFVGARLGFLLQETVLYMTVAPKIDLNFLDGRLKLGIEAPLNLEFFNLSDAADAGESSGGFENFGRLRKRDWDDPRDFVRILRYLQFGKKEDKLFVNVGRLYATTIGHGQAIRRYQANVDVDRAIVGMEVDAYNDYGGFEMSLADVTRGNLFGVLGFIKPLSFFTKDAMWRSLSLGAHWSSDQKTPWRLQRRPPVGAARIGPVEINETNAPLTIDRAVNIVGVDAEFKFFKNESVDLKSYFDFSMLNQRGKGFTLGVLGRFNFRTQKLVHLLRTRVEFKTYESNFTPSFFDILYEFQKFQFIADPDATGPEAADFPTKLRFLDTRGGPQRFGVYLEATYSLKDWFIFAAVLELDSQGQDRHLMLHLEVPFRYLDLFATYHQRNFQRPFTLDDNDLIFAGARLQILPILFLNGRVQKSFAWDGTRFNGLGGFAESLNYQLDVELGWAFD